MASRPPFPIPPGKSGHWKKVGGTEVSDGDVRHWPGLPLSRPAPETRYLTHLATIWVKEQNLDQLRKSPLAILSRRLQVVGSSCRLSYNPALLELPLNLLRVFACLVIGETAAFTEQ